MATVDVRLFAALRELAGAATVRAQGETVGAVLDRLAERFGERFAQIAGAGTVVVDGERVAADHPLAGGEEVAVLPPFSGGA